MYVSPNLHNTLPLLTHPTVHTDVRRRAALEAAQPTQPHPSAARVRAARARQVLCAASHTATAATSTALLPKRALKLSQVATPKLRTRHTRRK